MMWIYNSITKRFLGVAGEELPLSCGITSAVPPTLQLGQVCYLGDDNNWYIRDIQAVTPAQGKLALLRAGYLEQAEALIAQSPTEVKIWYSSALVWERTNPAVVNMGQALGLTPSQIDALFLGEV